MRYHCESIAPHEVRALDLRREIVALETTGTAFECARVHIDGQCSGRVYTPQRGHPHFLDPARIISPSGRNHFLRKAGMMSPHGQ